VLTLIGLEALLSSARARIEKVEEQLYIEEQLFLQLNFQQMEVQFVLTICWKFFELPFVGRSARSVGVDAVCALVVPDSGPLQVHRRSVFLTLKVPTNGSSICSYKYRSFIDQIYVYALVEYQVWSRKIAAVGN
jgi:hypothetical protein